MVYLSNKIFYKRKYKNKTFNMSDFNVPIIEPTVDYTKVPSINQKRTIAFINHFITNTITFLNKFALSCEEKLFHFENKLQRVEASLEILEARLSSIPQAESELKQETKSENKSAGDIGDNSNIEAQEISESINNNATELWAKETKTEQISLDPLYAKYFKMIHVGVPKQAIKLKMEQEGLDSSVLDNPHQAIPKQKINIPNEHLDGSSN